MNDKGSNSELPISRTPAENHRRQMLLQVWLPLGITLLVVLALVILTIVGAAQGSSQIERWGNISAIWVIIPVLISGIIILVVVGGSAYGMSKLLQKMPEWLLKAQLFMVHLSLTVRRAADAATKPIMASNTLSTRVATLVGKIFRRRSTPAV